MGGEHSLTMSMKPVSAIPWAFRRAHDTPKFHCLDTSHARHFAACVLVPVFITVHFYRLPFIKPVFKHQCSRPRSSVVAQYTFKVLESMTCADTSRRPVAADVSYKRVGKRLVLLHRLLKPYPLAADMLRYLDHYGATPSFHNNQPVCVDIVENLHPKPEHSGLALSELRSSAEGGGDVTDDPAGATGMFAAAWHAHVSVRSWM